MAEMSKEYATALFSLALEGGQAKEIGEGLSLMLDALRENPAYVDLLASPGIPKEERTAALAAAFREAVPAHALSFISLLCEKGRLREFDGCVAEYEELYRAHLRASEAEVTSAVPLTDDEKARLVARLCEVSGRTVHATWLVDESLVGGVVVRMDGRVMDGSVKHRLHEIKGVMSDERKA